jgi:hypothetical protein
VSQELRQYHSIEDLGSELMCVSAFVGGKYGKGVQFTIGRKYCELAENQVRDLRDTLTKRLRSCKGYKATDWGQSITVEPEIAP